MPGFDKTGPAGRGARTGRKMGNCNSEDYTTTEDLIGRIGRGLGRRLGKGFRFRNSGNFPGSGRRPRGKGF
jgi:hypothetical protein